MEHFDHTNKNSVFGSLVTVSLGWLSHTTKDDVLWWVTVTAGLVTIGYTLDKWIQSHKKEKK